MNAKMKIKILGVGCPKCQSMLNDVNRILERRQWQAEVDYVQDIAQILEYRIQGTPALVIDEQVVLIGHPGASRIEQALAEAHGE